MASSAIVVLSRKTLARLYHDRATTMLRGPQDNRRQLPISLAVGGSRRLKYDDATILPRLSRTVQDCRRLSPRLSPIVGDLLHQIVRPCQDFAKNIQDFAKTKPRSLYDPCTTIQTVVGLTQTLPRLSPDSPTILAIVHVL